MLGIDCGDDFTEFAGAVAAKAAPPPDPPAAAPLGPAWPAFACPSTVRFRAAGGLSSAEVGLSDFGAGGLPMRPSSLLYSKGSDSAFGLTWPVSSARRSAQYRTDKTW